MAKKRGAKRQKVETSQRQKAAAAEREYAENPCCPHEGPCGPGTSIDFGLLAEYLETMADMSCSGHQSLEQIDVGNIACFVGNEGTVQEKAEALLSIMPVAKRVWDRKSAECEAERAERAAERAKR